MDFAQALPETGGQGHGNPGFPTLQPVVGRLLRPAPRAGRRYVFSYASPRIAIAALRPFTAITLPPG